jgi:hypothetical protein
MPLRSHIDLCFFVRFIHVPLRMVDAELRKSLNDEGDIDAAFAAWSEHHDANKALMFHETYHYWQGLRLPFLYRYAVAATRIIFLAFREFSRHSKDWEEWSAEIPTLHLLNVNRRCVQWSATKLGIVPDNYQRDNLLQDTQISIIELLESATSLAEWQASVSGDVDATNPLHFERWRKRNPSYDRAYRFLSKSIGETVAIRCCLPLINACFHTSDPVRAFTGLISVLGSQIETKSLQAILKQPEPCKWDEVMSLYLDMLTYDATLDAEFDVTSPAGFYRISLHQSLDVSYADSEYAHPFLTSLAREWALLEKTMPQYSWTLSAPRWFSDVGEAYNRFAPPLTVAHFQVDRNRSRTVFIGDEKRGMSLQKLPLSEFLTVYSAVRKTTGAFFDPADRLCHSAPYRRRAENRQNDSV